MTIPESDAAQASRISEAARRLLAQGQVGDEPLRRTGAVLDPLPVLSAADEQRQMWFVPVTVGDRLVAFFQFTLDGALMRFSTFQHHPGDLAGCPLAAHWLDRDQIRGRANTQRHADESIGEPFLSYDGPPDRLVWVVPLTSVDGRLRHVYVAGETAYTPPPPGSFG